MIQMSEKNKSPLSEKVRMSMVERELALKRFKETNSQEDLRDYRNIRNTVNSLIGKERYNRKVRSYQGEEVRMSDKWKTAKKDTGQAQFISPQIIEEKKKIPHWTC